MRFSKEFEAEGGLRFVQTRFAYHSESISVCLYNDKDASIANFGLISILVISICP